MKILKTTTTNDISKDWCIKILTETLIEDENKKRLLILLTFMADAKVSEIGFIGGVKVHVHVNKVLKHSININKKNELRQKRFIKFNQENATLLSDLIVEHFPSTWINCLAK